MAEIEWADTAFSQLEALGHSLAFDVVRRIDVLSTFPSAGSRIVSRDPHLKNCRQLIIGRTHRVISEYDEAASIVFIFAVQSCRQRLPRTRDLKRRESPEKY
jgi:hypothetical protein